MKPAKPVAPSPVEGETPLTCDVCGAVAFEVRCKIICGKCGYTRDCSDP
jgi:ribosomal protein L37E